MLDRFQARVWVKSLPSREHPERNEDLAWSAANGMAHAVIDGMGGSRRIVDGREIGGEHAAAGVVAVLNERLQDLPANISVGTARELLSVVVAEAGARIYGEVNVSGQIPQEQLPEGKTVEDVMAAAVMTAAIFCDGARRAVIGQNGDTRAYLFSDGELLLLTDDQDAVMLDVLEGKLTAEEADAIQEAMDNFDGRDIGQLDPKARAYFFRRNMLFGQIGDSPEPRPPEFATIQLRTGDMLALVSDGVYANLSTSEIRDALVSIDPAASLVDRADSRSGERPLPDPGDLSALCNYRAHQDDATAVVVQVGW
ncbi:MAG: protein phosphatase 2C domain-containing protein [Chloroflexota bacterium]|nr:protein phosphatase 2C domain-containing protein [Chloroflexota bacterium]